MPALFDSLIAQTYKNIEIIAVNDGSEDGSGEICRSYARKDSRILFYETENRGVARARNYGLEMSSGEYIMFLDSDDRYAPDGVEKLVDAAEKSGADIVSAGLVRHDSTGVHKIACTRYKGEVEGDELYSVLRDAFFGADGALCSFIDKVYRAELIKERNIRFPAISSGEDTVFALEAIICASKMFFLEDHFFYEYLITEGSFTQKKYLVEKRIEFSNLFFAECEKLIEKYGMSFLREAFDGRRALAVYDFVMNTVSRKDLSKNEVLDGLARICSEKYYTDISESRVLKEHSFRVRTVTKLAAKEKTKELYLFSRLLCSIKKFIRR